jgi:hypothetical protein
MLTASEADVEELVVPDERIYRRCQCMSLRKTPIREVFALDHDEIGFTAVNLS